MHLYNLTLQRATGITHAIRGNFGGIKSEEILVSRGTSLELLYYDHSIGKIQSLHSVQVFGVIRSLTTFRLPDGTKDYIVVGSDSGKIIILEYLPQKNVFEKVHEETFGKPGCRRDVPGQYVAVDPSGRALMISAIENQKLVYSLNRDAESRLTFSLPLEVPKSSTFVYDVVGVDVGSKDPVFACLEVYYDDDNDPKSKPAHKIRQTLALYEFDFKHNSVVCKSKELLEDRANFLIPIAAGGSGPNGVLICAENYIIYKPLDECVYIRCPIPRRRNDLGDPERGVIFVCSAIYKTKSFFLILAQTEYGDMFKITLKVEGKIVTAIRLKYFDTVPVSVAMCVLKSGFLFIASEFGNQFLYRITHLGDQDNEPEFTSNTPLEEGDMFFFVPRLLRNLTLVDELDSLSPIMACQAADLVDENTPQLYMLCGRGPRSTVRVLSHGLEVSEVAISELPGNPVAVWTVKRSSHGYDYYIVVTFINATMILSIGEIIEEVFNSGFIETVPTLCCCSFSDDSLIQIHPNGIRHIRADKHINDWSVPGKKVIIKCAVNLKQVVIALAAGELIYFEMDSTGLLNEYIEHKEMPSEVVCIALMKAIQGCLSEYVAVGLVDNTVHIMSLNQSTSFSVICMHTLPSTVESLCIVEMYSPAALQGGLEAQVHLYVGLKNGGFWQTVIGQSSVTLSDTDVQYLGSCPVKLFSIYVQGNEAVLALSSRSWLNYRYQNSFHLIPLSYITLQYVSEFSSELCPEGIVAISTNTLRILTFGKLGTVFNQVSFPIEYTPRQFAIHEESGYLVIVESDQKIYTEDSKKQRQLQIAKELQEVSGELEQQFANEMVEAFLNEDLPENVFGAPKAAPGTWASALRILDPKQERTVLLHKLEQNEAALSVALVKFENQPDQQFIIIGVAKDYHLGLHQISGAFLYTYRINAECTDMELIHKTIVEDVPTRICEFQGRILVGVGKILRMYDIGKKKLLKKCENKCCPNLVVDIQTVQERVFVSDVQDSVYMIEFKPQDLMLVVFACDTHPRWITSSVILDYDTIATADKFGNISVIRLVDNITDNNENDSEIGVCDKGSAYDRIQKASVIANFHIGEMCSSLQKITLVPNGDECILYTTLSGTIGVLVPFTSNEDQDFLQRLEMHMRIENLSLCGRSHLLFRSYYYPVKNVVDGDLCEQFNSIDTNKQKNIAIALDRIPRTVSKKLEDIRATCTF